jgi:hypothetical protein
MIQDALFIMLFVLIAWLRAPKNYAVAVWTVMFWWIVGTALGVVALRLLSWWMR